MEIKTMNFVPGKPDVNLDVLFFSEMSGWTINSHVAGPKSFDSNSGIKF